MKGLLKKVKESHNIALILFAILGVILNETLNLGVEETVLRTLANTIIELL